eukprot:Sro102_g051980.1 n/a (520) ;mRNA; r:40306-41865
MDFAEGRRHTKLSKGSAAVSQLQDVSSQQRQQSRTSKKGAVVSREKLQASSLHLSPQSSTKLDTYNPDQAIWALVTPPGFLGGYRNQVIRMFGLVLGAKKHGIEQVLLTSILWSTTTKERAPRPVPMEDLFDIDHWNYVAKTSQLPTLVSSIPSGDCWSSTAEGLREENRNLTDKLHRQQDAPLLKRVLEAPRFLTPIANISLGYVTGELSINPRRFHVSDQVQHCKHPLPYGYGGGRGVLWVNYMDYSRQRQRDAASKLVKPDPLERSFLQALRPLPKWRQLAQECVASGTGHKHWLGSNTPSYIALHPRIELEMMLHSCGNYMNKNFTRILDDVSKFLVQQRQHADNHSYRNVSGIFVAFSREGASVQEGNGYRRFHAHVDQNIQTMDRVLGNGETPGQGILLRQSKSSEKTREQQRLPIFECGDRLLQSHYESQSNETIDYGSLLPSIINFQVAVESTAFVGMRFSSWSNSVWTTRYYLGRGDANFEYTRERGIQPVGNGGLPPPHGNCDGIQDPG